MPRIIRGIDATLVFYDDTKIVDVRMNKGNGWRTEIQLQPEVAELLNESLDSAEWSACDKLPGHAQIAFDNDTGKLRLLTAGGVDYFDPGKEESLAKLVRRLKGMASASAQSREPVLPNLLPEPTPEQFANRTIATQVGVPDGVGTYKRPRQRYNAPTASALKTKEILDGLMARMLTSGG